MNGAAFRASVEQVLAPTIAPDDVITLDNLPAHRAAGVRAAIEARGARLMYLPPSSPDFNPIGNAFVKLRAILRKARARTIDALWDAVRDALPQFTPGDCANYFTATGCEPE